MNTSCTTSSASATLPSIRYATANEYGRSSRYSSLMSSLTARLLARRVDRPLRAAKQADGVLGPSLEPIATKASHEIEAEECVSQRAHVRAARELRLLTGALERGDQQPPMLLEHDAAGVRRAVPVCGRIGKSRSEERGEAMHVPEPAEVLDDREQCGPHVACASDRPVRRNEGQRCGTASGRGTGRSPRPDRKPSR